MGAKDADPRESWPTRSQAALRAGVSKTTIHRKEKTGELHPIQLNGIWRFDPEELDNIQAPDEELDPVGQFAKVIAEFTTMLKTAHEHIVDLHKPAANIFDLQFKEIESLRDRAAKYEDRHFAMLEMTETLQKEAHAREMERLKEEAGERRKQWAMQLVQNQIIPAFMNRNVGSKLLDRVLKLELPQIEMLANSGLLDQDTMVELLKLWEQAHKAPIESEDSNGKEENPPS